MNIPFAEINQAAMPILPSLVAEWFPGGKMQGREFVTGSLTGGAGRSLSINTRTGVWKDFSDGSGGADPISLYAAAFHQDRQGEAAKALAHKLGFDIAAQPGEQRRPAAAPRPRDPDEWFPMPPPADAPDPDGLDRFSGVWVYRDAAGSRLNYVVRSEPTAKRPKKVVFAITWGRRIWTEKGQLRDQTGWHNKHPLPPMALYGLDRLAARPNATVIITEGEKACDAATRMFPDHVCITWPRGSKNVLKADWSPLAGRDVIIWPDNDPPGIAAARDVKEALAEIGVAAVRLELHEMPEGGDAADITVDDPAAWLADHMPSPADDDGLAEGEEPDLEFAPIDENSLPARDWQDIINSTIRDLNSKYALVNENGKAVIFQDGYDELMRRRRIDRISTTDFRIMHLNNKIQTGVTKKGEAIYSPLGSLWIGSPNRRQFIDGVVFDPTTTEARPGVLNLWQGYAVKAAAGDWSLLRSHIRDVICDNDPDRFKYLMGWMARMLQFPAQQGETAVVMKGGEGTGKGTLAKALIKIIGQHALQISNPKHLIGNFNGHLRDAIFLFADEAFFAGDRAHVGVLKSIITEPYLTVEAKHQNAVQMPNFLHVIMASNEEWVIPASIDARRFFVLEVNDTAKNNHDYFAEILAQLEAGGYAAMLHELLTADLSMFNVRDVPKTGALQQQQKLSLPIPDLWWKDCLERGYVFRSQIGLELQLSRWFESISTELLYSSYMEFARSRSDRNIMSRETLGRFMVKVGGTGGRLPIKSPIGEHLTDIPNAFGGTSRAAQLIEKDRPTGYKIGRLADAQAAFCEMSGLKIVWSSDEP